MQRIFLIVVAVLVLVGLVGYAVLARQHGSALEELRTERDEMVAAAQDDCAATVRELALDLTRAVAALIADEVAVGDTSQLDAALAAAVRGEHVAGVLVFDTNGTVLAATDLRYRGRTLDDAATRAALDSTDVLVAEEPPAPGQIEVQAPLYMGGEKVGAMRVFVELGELAGR